MFQIPEKGFSALGRIQERWNDAKPTGKAASLFHNALVPESGPHLWLRTRGVALTQRL